MGKKRKQLTQEEIWDDSALINSWNEAYEEYKYYHSLHARGEKVSEVLDAYEREESVENSVKKIEADHRPKGSGVTNGDAAEQTSSDEEGEIAEEAVENDHYDNDVAMSHADEDKASKDAQQTQPFSKDPDKNTGKVTTNAKNDHPDAPTADSAATAEPTTSSGAAQTLIDSFQDPALKSLMMSWYWAGYYTGLYEGQRQAASHNSDTGSGAAPGPTSSE